MALSSKKYLLLLLLLTVMASGCSVTTPEAVYYSLTPSEEIFIGKTMPSPNTLAIGIGPVKFPYELDRPSIVTRSGQNRLVINEFQRWGGSLEKNFLRVMADNLTNLLKTDQVMTRPWEHYFQPDIRLALDIHQFDGRLGESASLTVTWVIYREGQETGAVVHRSVLNEPLAEKSYDALVAAQSRLVARLAEEIAQAMLKL